MSERKAALVTGSTSGIGLAVATAYAKAGMDVTLNGLGDPAAIEKIRADLAAETGVKVRFDGADLTKAEACAGMIEAAEGAFGRLDVLVNNAGTQFVAPIEDFPVDKYNTIIALNLSSGFHTIRAAMRGMKERKYGRIINICSAHAHVASPFKSAYVAAKHGLLGLTKTVALEGATFNVRCNAISPGYVFTSLVENQIPDTMKARNMTREQVINDVLLAAQPTKQFVKVEDIAGMALFLTTPPADQINGAAFNVDGGWTAQ
jgi:3-hydroxybutyrate dehydrogenase